MYDSLPGNRKIFSSCTESKSLEVYDDEQTGSGVREVAGIERIPKIAKNCLRYY